jgi:hypothetical protein
MSTPLDVPSANQNPFGTQANGVNTSGQIVGQYLNSITLPR